MRVGRFTVTIEFVGDTAYSLKITRPKYDPTLTRPLSGVRRQTDKFPMRSPSRNGASRDRPTTPAQREYFVQKVTVECSPRCFRVALSNANNDNNKAVPLENRDFAGNGPFFSVGRSLAPRGRLRGRNNSPRRTNQLLGSRTT